MRSAFVTNSNEHQSVKLIYFYLITINMAYIRTKKIGKNKYAYLVEIVSTDKGPRQKVKQYLGRVYDFEKSKEVSEINEGKTKEEILLDKLIKEVILYR